MGLAWVGWGGSRAIDVSRLPRSTPPKVQRVRGGFACCAHCCDELDVPARCTSSGQIREIREASVEQLERQLVGGCVLDVDDELEYRARLARYESPTIRGRGLLERLLRRNPN
jgi:hypothetical protein